VTPTIDLTGKVAIVTGAASGIGEASALRLAEAGSQLVLVDMDDAQVHRLSERVPGSVPVVADVASEDGTAAYVEAAVKAFGRVDLFHANAGILGRPALLADATAEDFHRIMGVNVLGCFLGLRAVIGQMVAQGGGGSIVVTASIAGLRSSPGVSLYAASKFAVLGLARTAAKEYGAHGIRVNAICPGPTDTNFNPARHADQDLYQAQMAQLATQVPLGRVARADDMARAVAWLLSDHAAFINGAVLPVDGGQTA
jgi:3-oxoacyl-[acyl-carrier protein] reductase